MSDCTATGATQDPNNNYACNCQNDYYLDGSTCVACPTGSTADRGATVITDCGK